MIDDDIFANDYANQVIEEIQRKNKPVFNKDMISFTVLCLLKENKLKFQLTN